MKDMSQAFDLTGQKAIVTGAGRGLGHHMAVALAQAGADLALASRTIEDLERTANEIRALGTKALVVEVDVTRLEDIHRMVDCVLDDYGRIDILVNNAGCNVRKPSVEITEEDWGLVVGTNLKGAFFCAQAVGSQMIAQRKGKIINIGSGTSLFGFPEIVPYCASRGGIVQMTKALAAEWAPYCVNVNAIAPGWFETSQTEVLFRNEAWLKSILERIPWGRTGEPEDLAGLTIFLASDASDYVTGQTIFVDGGFTLGAIKARVD
jgi:NAD(P)-dependent dehydrogenase (short-subunit alcohol dehydrogenase family)